MDAVGAGVHGFAPVVVDEQACVVPLTASTAAHFGTDGSGLVAF
jgi:hypothetical protein